MAPEHPALIALHNLADRTDVRIADEHNWRIGEIDPATVRRAAVLVLFGVLDDVPAASATAGGPIGENVGDDVDVLIVVRAATLRKHAGQPAFPGGKIDPEDYVEARERNVPVEHVAALREAVEETGLDPAGVQILGSLNEKPLPISNFMVTPVLAWWNSTSTVAAQDTNESSLVLRVPVRDLLNPANRHMAQVSRGKTRHNSPAFTVTTEASPQGHFVIWGFTGIILDQLFRELGWAVDWDKSDRRPAPGTR
ncbi:CoA pyrophosphatase [Rothia sp. LK2588]|uniref:CoA pyrophosphatase n=1 Tax=Rothia sp. LK2588 TaxID=3114369 RepID=UPI0034CDA08E